MPDISFEYKSDISNGNEGSNLGRWGGGYSVCKWEPTAVQLVQSGWCRNARWPKKGGCPLIILYDKGAVFASNIIYPITFKFVLETFQNNNVVKYDIYNTDNSALLISRGCS